MYNNHEASPYPTASLHLELKAHFDDLLHQGTATSKYHKEINLTAFPDGNPQEPYVRISSHHIPDVSGDWGPQDPIYTIDTIYPGTRSTRPLAVNVTRLVFSDGKFISPQTLEEPNKKTGLYQEISDEHALSLIVQLRSSEYRVRQPHYLDQATTFARRTGKFVANATMQKVHSKATALQIRYQNRKR